MRKKKKVLSIILTGIILLTLTGCSNDEPSDKSGKLRVGVTINPLKEFTELIGGDKVEVFSIIPKGSDPHDFDPKPKDLKDLVNANMFVYNGLGMEGWVDSVISTIENTDVKIVDSSVGVNVINIEAEEDTNHEGETEEEHEGHDHGDVDPHIWLSLNEATVQAENIKNALVEIDSENKEYYEENFNKLKSDFSNMYNEYKVKFENVKNKDFITGHAAFAYLCRDFGLEQKSIQGINGGDGEIQPQTLAELAKYTKENNVKVIFSESTASVANAQALANETGARVEKIYSLETKEDDKSYLEGMKYNLDKILEIANNQN